MEFDVDRDVGGECVPVKRDRIVDHGLRGRVDVDVEGWIDDQASHAVATLGGR